MTRVNDPQGLTVLGALKNLGFTSVADVRVGKFLEVKIDATDRAEAVVVATGLCQKLLANPVIEEYRVEEVAGLDRPGGGRLRAHDFGRSRASTMFVVCVYGSKTSRASPEASWALT